MPLGFCQDQLVCWFIYLFPVSLMYDLLSMAVCEAPQTKLGVAVPCLQGGHCPVVEADAYTGGWQHGSVCTVVEECVNSGVGVWELWQSGKTSRRG